MELTVHEAMAQYGAQVLPETKLLQVILGNENAVAKLMEDEKDLYRVLQSDAETLEHKGLTMIQSHKIAAVIELARRYNIAKGSFLSRLTTPDDMYHYLRPKLTYLNRECFVVVCLNSKNKVVAEKTVSTGSLTGCVVHPREVFKVAVEHSAAAIVVAHNHPSGDPTPSREDNEVTQMLVSAGKVMGIPVLDHIIIGDNQYFSYQEEGRM